MEDDEIRRAVGKTGNPAPPPSFEIGLTDLAKSREAYNSTIL